MCLQLGTRVPRLTENLCQRKQTLLAWHQTQSVIELRVYDILELTGAVLGCRLQGVLAAESPLREVERVNLLARIAESHLAALAGACEAESGARAQHGLQERYATVREQALSALLQDALALCSSGDTHTHKLVSWSSVRERACCLLGCAAGSAHLWALGTGSSLVRACISMLWLPWACSLATSNSGTLAATAQAAIWPHICTPIEAGQVQTWSPRTASPCCSAWRAWQRRTEPLPSSLTCARPSTMPHACTGTCSALWPLHQVTRAAQSTCSGAWWLRAAVTASSACPAASPSL